jgi:hypothetical protein
MAATPEVKAARDSTAAILNTLRSQFISKLDTVQSFITSYSQYNLGVGLFEDAIDITVKGVDDISAYLNNINFIAPPRPAGLDSTQPEKFKTHVYEAWQLDGLETKLMNIVTNADTGTLKELAGVGVPIGLQEAMYQYQVDVDRQDLEYELDILDGKWAQDGYVLPPDALVHNRAWLTERYSQKRTDRTRNVYAEITKLAQQNVQWAYENGIKVEQLHSSFAIEYSKIFKDVIDAIVTVYKADVEIAITQMEVAIKQLTARIDVAKLEIGRDEAAMKLEIDQANNRLSNHVQAYHASIATNADITKSRIGAATNVATGYQSMFNSQATQFTDINLETNKRSS